MSDNVIKINLGSQSIPVSLYDSDVKLTFAVVRQDGLTADDINDRPPAFYRWLGVRWRKASSLPFIAIAMSMASAKWEKVSEFFPHIFEKLVG